MPAPMPMPAQGAPSPGGAVPPPAAAQPGGGGDASRLVASIHKDLGRLAEMVAQAGAATPEDKQAAQELVSNFEEFVETRLAAPPGKNPQAPAPVPQRGPTPVEAGSADVRQAM